MSEPDSEKVADIVRGRENLDYLTRLREREAFDEGINSQAMALLKRRIREFTGKVEECQFSAVFWNLTTKLNADEALMDELAELHWLPIGEESQQRRLSAFDCGVQRHLPDAIREELPELGTVCITTALRCN